MCVFTPATQEDRDRYQETLEGKLYREISDGPLLPFEYLWDGTSWCHVEPCDTGAWPMAFAHQLARTTDQQEEQPAHHHEGWATDHHLQQVLSGAEGSGAAGAEEHGAADL